MPLETTQTGQIFHSKSLVYNILYWWAFLPPPGHFWPPCSTHRLCTVIPRSVTSATLRGEVRWGQGYNCPFPRICICKARGLLPWTHFCTKLLRLKNLPFTQFLHNSNSLAIHFQLLYFPRQELKEKTCAVLIDRMLSNKICWAGC